MHDERMMVQLKRLRFLVLFVWLACMGPSGSCVKASQSAVAAVAVAVVVPWYSQVWDYLGYIWYTLFYKRGGVERGLISDQIKHDDFLRKLMMFTKNQPKIKDRGSYFRGRNHRNIIRNSELWKYK